MFSGIVQQVGNVQRSEINPDGSGRLRLEAPGWNEPLAKGESIACDGVCLTLSEINDRSLSFDILKETYAKTNLAELISGDLVNLERALRMGDVIGGHFVTGHVDGTGTTSAWDSHGRDYIWRIKCSKIITAGMVAKGSIACDGISLTIVDLSDEEFTVHIIPHTVANTALRAVQVGRKVNLETDMLGKYAARAVAGLSLPK